MIRSFILAFPFRPHCTRRHYALCRLTGYAFGLCGESTRPPMPGRG